MNRIDHYRKKIRAARANGSLTTRTRRFLVISVMRPIETLVGYARLSREDQRLNVGDGFADHRGNPREHRADPDHLKRIVAAYRAAKSAQGDADEPFAVRGIWAEWISVHYEKLIEALQDDDLGALSELLENVFRERCTAGIGGYDTYVRYRSPLGPMYIKYVWSRYRNMLANLGFDPQNVEFPNIGNQVGVLVGDRVISIDTLRHAYHAVEMRDLLTDVSNAVCVEIGAGVGGQPYQAVRIGGDSIAKYLVFDIPEVAVLSGYFLLAALPDRRVRLYGEGPVSVAEDEEYDIAVFPHFAVSQLPDSSIDLFYNSCSFSEMDGTSSRAYLSVIERTCRKYFLHDNHDIVFTFTNPDGSTSTNIIGSELVPNPAKFKRVFKKPRVHGLPEDRAFTQYQYLYQRIAT
ncbi:putative sugar O-methyltransferase [Mycolicibacterium sp. NCC-Tsukiji]|uniref:putative sugar O-methyltransferase n=1 Tax=Mycobacteriaceae TaxID=1762 RepID=UPI000ED536C9|nr:putative sugar O-methyltransferase [Mycolicibacterium sp. NCC-Tsukiji]GCB01217.1 hypothetical protein NCCNTM_48510 [Mycolicibacterium sp. NCC-Tsukiji]